MNNTKSSSNIIWSTKTEYYCLQANKETKIETDDDDYSIKVEQVIDDNRKDTIVVNARVNVPSDYLRPLVAQAFSTIQSRTNIRWNVMTKEDETAKLIWDEYENINWKNVLKPSSSVIASSFCHRKGISRKAQLSLYTSKYSQKYPKSSCLASHIPKTIVIDIWEAYESSTSTGNGMFNMSFSQRLESCIWEAQNAMRDHHSEIKRWILKPSASNKGAEIHVIDCYEELVAVLKKWGRDIREWVLQAYVDNPLLVLPQKRKFHIRTYVLAVKNLAVYVHKDMLVLTSLASYSNDDISDTYVHLTNTSFQTSHPEFKTKKSVFALSEEILPSSCDSVKEQIYQITSEVFDAYRNEFTVFQPLPNAFELYGLDFVVDEDRNVWFLEVNPGPDFKQTGDELNHIIQSLMTDTLSIVTHAFYDNSNTECDLGGFKQVYDQEWGFKK